jgi:RNA polymerase sigma factor (sigma-70 family)
MATGVAGSVARQVAALAADRAADGLSDADLLRVFTATADQAAFAALVRRHGPLVVGVCRRTARHAQDAEDAFQATFLLLARRAGSIRRRESLAGWLHGVAFRMSRNANRAAARRARHERGAWGPGREPESPATQAALRDLQALLDEEVARLPDLYRAPFVLCCLEQRASADVGRTLGLKEATVWGRVAQARRLLRDRLARRGVALTAVLAAAAVAGPELPAAVGGFLLAATSRGAALAAAGGRAPNGVIPPRVATLLRGAERSASTSLGKATAALVLAVGGAAAAVGMWAGQAPADTPPVTSPGRPAPAPGEAGTGTGKPAADPVDGHGDPLPPGATARLGTVRFRHGSMVTGLRYAAEGKTIVTGGYDQALRAWDAASGREVARLAGPGLGSVVDVGASADGRTVAAVDYSGNVVLGDFPARRLTRPGFQPDGRNTCVGLSPDGKALAVGAPDHTVRLYDLAAGKAAGVLRGHAGVVRRVAFAADGTAVAAGGDDGTVRVWDRATGAETLRLDAGEPVRSVAFSPDGKVLAGGGGAEDRGGSADRQFGRLRLWALPSGKLMHALGSHYPYVAAVAFAPDGRTVAAAAWGGRVELWDVAAGKRIRQVRTVAEAVAFSPDGGTLATGGNDRTVRQWDPATGKERDPGRPGHTGGVRVVAASRDGAVVATAGGDALVRLWDPATGRELRAIDASSTWFGGTGAMALSADGTRVATDKGIWDAATGKFLSGGDGRRPAFRGQDYSIEAIAFAPDGKTLAIATRSPGAAGRDRTIRLWEAATAREVGGFGTDPVHSLAYAPNGTVLAAGAQDGSVMLWDPATGKELRRLRGHKREVNSVAFSPDGRLVASSDFEGGIVLWEVRTGR